MNAPIAATPPDCGLFPDGRLLHRWFFRVSYAGMAGVMTLGFGLRTAGMANMPMRGPVLVVANHQSYLDPPIIGLAVRREMVYLARKTLFRNPLFARMISTYNAVPIDQEGIGKEGIRTILDQLQLGRAVLVFPEGARTFDGKMHPLRPGIHLLIKRTRALVVPVGIAGAYDAWPIGQPLPIPAPLFMPALRGSIAVVVGQPEDPHDYADLPRDRAMSALFDRIAAVQRQAEHLRRKL